jgi:anti-sigma factor RsiW
VNRPARSFTHTWTANWTLCGLPNSSVTLSSAPECVTALEAQESLRNALQRAHLYEKAPPALQQKVFANIRPAQPVVIKPRALHWRWLGAAAAILLLAYAGWRIIPGWRNDGYPSFIAAQIVDAHLRSLQPGHLTDVVSSDQHTVKPWFDGKLDFSPPVHDFRTTVSPFRAAASMLSTAIR